MRFKRWSENGLFWFLVHELQQKKKLNLDFAWIDSTTIGLHRHGSGSLKNGSQLIGRGRKGLSTKIHVGLSLGCIKSACLSEGQRTDMKIFPKLWSLGNWQDINDIIADRGYDYYDVRVLIQQAKKQPIIPRIGGAVFPGVQDKYKEKYATRFNI